MKVFVLFFLFSIMLISLPVFSSDEPSNIFLEANQAYNKGDYDGAISLYEKLLNSGIRNGLLYYNLGNCYFRKGETGRAIFNYKNGKLYSPRDEDLTANLNYARQNIKDRTEIKDPEIRRRIFFWYYSLNLKELFMIFLVFNGIFWISAILKIFKPLPLLRAVFFVSLFIMLSSGISAATKFYVMENLKDGVVLAEEVSVRSGNSSNDTILFKLHEGTEIEILDESDGWLKIKLPHGSKDMRGWVEKGFVGIV
ncbi:MAG: hypothetical protein A3C43_05280 [Candidatus Schekmanbacteria bacterium RIFCSPHIGHO2_02_FULL_38_11]|uniref:SH3b domain-containing protein n=1 Tax=Candidatus Schekmanbacteria bacterium RIFCSPLOWO2_12_FULL_38_15 TaxID=1817883 RepID=A0A1F7SCB8_9BACT|nr:MAG: hypothetical protein A2043_03255 [Candidatus Schekmanbacteria bacterium GWA2_38_9]OGL51420.1 MAG: hypothetical protein A3G31_06085 [Candidatus Schekmanbacteria bacterium RIFCSPLOWO2_12_FULL_38_15]OGL51573.1 MAG: hypothetical protein A3H37_09480 [Candidatus Schekmanbacteria bacterium RIFCSPLOWO2_02_FULL_38_14]OGL53196.1 MAG: hypothetical protein A3C43_05280 [Candidatus Schekmanbacteria bacterium RIFCSPHIGHO2_02_FULL_38_11]